MMLSAEMEAIVLVKQRERERLSGNQMMDAELGRINNRSVVVSSVGMTSEGNCEAEQGWPGVRQREIIDQGCPLIAKRGQVSGPVALSAIHPLGHPFRMESQFNIRNRRPTERARAPTSRTVRWDWWLLEKLTAEHIHLGRARLPFQLPVVRLRRAPIERARGGWKRGQWRRQFGRVKNRVLCVVP